MIVKLTQNLSKGFLTWKKMVHENRETLKEYNGSIIFAGTEKEDDSKLTLILEFDNPEGLQKFANDEELKAKGAAAGAMLETTIVTPMSTESFTNFKP